MPKRPEIPEPTRRDVLMAAGHRCAVCGLTHPLELAHIRKWSESKDHSAGNLLPLCGNCHALLDLGRFDAKTLRDYKARPWVLRWQSHGAQIAEGGSLPLDLHQIQVPPNDFQGREEEIAALRAELESGRPVAICGLHGMGGVGKTTLAQKLAYELRARYPDAQIYLDLKGVSTTPLTPAEAMGHVIRSFYPEAPVSQDEAELAGRYRATLHGKRVLLLMDNAASAEQIEPLRPPEGCALLVTSRNRIVCEDLILQDLDTLPPNESEALLLEIAPRTGELAQEIAKLCGFLPFALRLAGSHLAKRKALAPSEYIQRLKATQRKFPKMDASLRLSYELLSEEEQRLWRLLGVFSESFDSAAAAAVWEVGEEHADEILEELEMKSLIYWNEAGGRFRFHDLARDLALQLLGGEEGERARLRHACYFLAVLDRIGSLKGQSLGQYIEGLILFNAERENLKLAVAWAESEVASRNELSPELNVDLENAALALTLLTLKTQFLAGPESVEDSLECARKFFSEHMQ